MGQHCPSDVGDAYDVYKGNCMNGLGGGYNIALNKTQFLEQSGTLSTYLSTSFWNQYDDCVRNGCLVPLTVASGCEISDNSCVCTNSTFVEQIAGCTGKACPTEIEDVYSIFSNVCSDDGGYTLALSKSQWSTAAGTGSAPQSASSSPSSRFLSLASADRL